MYRLKLTEIKTGLKGILERVPLQKNMSKASQNVFFAFVSQFHKVHGNLKLFQNISHKWNTVFIDQSCVE